MARNEGFSLNPRDETTVAGSLWEILFVSLIIRRILIGDII